jgi:hypothetical protein
VTAAVLTVAGTIVVTAGACETLVLSNNFLIVLVTFTKDTGIGFLALF